MNFPGNEAGSGCPNMWKCDSAMSTTVWYILFGCGLDIKKKCLVCTWNTYDLKTVLPK